MGLVLVKKPFYNEAGFDGYEREEAYKVESLLYSEKAYVMARGFVRHVLLNPVVGLQDVLAWVYLGGYWNGGRGEEQQGQGQGQGHEQGHEQQMEIDGTGNGNGDGKGNGKGNGQGKLTVPNQKQCVSASASEAEGQRPELLRTLIQRARALIDHSSRCSAEERDGLVDGAGERNAEAFIRPLSQGAVVMLRRRLEALEKAFQVQG